jgi:hypothetical protein
MTIFMRDPRLFENACECLSPEVLSRLPRDRDRSAFRRMLELSVAAFGPRKIPTVVAEQS